MFDDPALGTTLGRMATATIVIGSRSSGSENKWSANLIAAGGVSQSVDPVGSYAEAQERASQNHAELQIPADIEAEMTAAGVGPGG